jgi:hypothetical protein
VALTTPALLLRILFSSVPAAAATPPKVVPSLAKCERASEQLYGRVAVRADAKSSVPTPKKRRDASPAYPSRLPRSCFGGGGLHEVLIAPSGRVERVWTLKTPCSEVAAALEAAIRQWEYEPMELQGKPVPFCMVVATRLHPR